MQLSKPFRSLLRNRSVAPAAPLPIPAPAPIPKQYTVVLSSALLLVLDAGLSRAIIDRLQRPDVVAPELVEDMGINFYEFSVRERAIFRYQRADHFALDTLLTINQWLWEGAGNFVGTLAELDLLCSWAEHEQDLLSLTTLPFRQFRDANNNLIHPQTIDGMFGELIGSIDMVSDQLTPFQFAIGLGRGLAWPGIAWLFRKKKNWSVEVGFS